MTSNQHRKQRSGPKRWVVVLLACTACSSTESGNPEATPAGAPTPEGTTFPTVPATGTGPFVPPFPPGPQPSMVQPYIPEPPATHPPVSGTGTGVSPVASGAPTAVAADAGVPDVEPSSERAQPQPAVVDGPPEGSGGTIPATVAAEVNVASGCFGADAGEAEGAAGAPCSARRDAGR